MRQRFGNAGKKLDILIDDGLGKTHDAFMFFRRDGLARKAFEAGNQRRRKLDTP